MGVSTSMLSSAANNATATTDSINQMVEKDDPIALGNFLRSLQGTEDSYYSAYSAACSACVHPIGSSSLGEEERPSIPTNCLIMLSYEVTDAKTQEIYSDHLVELYHKRPSALLYLLKNPHTNPDPNLYAGVFGLTTFGNYESRRGLLMALLPYLDFTNCSVENQVSIILMAATDSELWNTFLQTAPGVLNFDFDQTLQGLPGYREHCLAHRTEILSRGLRLNDAFFL